MSGPSGHEREPDQAALDELERAFAEGRDAEPAGSPTETPEPSGPELDERRVAPSAHGPSVDPPVDVAPDVPDVPDVPEEVGSPRDGGEPEDPEPRDRFDGSDAVDDPSDGVAAGESVAVGGLGGLGEERDPDALDELDDLDEFDDDDHPEQIRIVEAEPVADPSASAPTIIRIDDFSGSVAIEDASGDHVFPEGVAPPSSEIDADDRRDERQSGDADPIVIEIDDGEMPDAVYVEGSLDQSGSRSIVFIEDDDTGDTLAPEAERDIRRGIEPRMRERRVAIKRAKGRKRLKWVVLIGAVVVLVVGALAVLGSGWFAIQEDQVVVTGNVYTDPERLEDVVDDLVGTPVLLADTQGAERDLEAIPWVDTAKVRTDFPHGVTIEIRERKAISTYRGPDLQFRVLDREGRVLDVIEKYPIAYVLLAGPDPVDLDAGEFAPRGYAAASELAKNLTGSVRGSVVRIEVTSDGSSLVMFLDNDVQVRFGEARDLFTKLVRLETVLSAGGAGESTVIDVSTNEVTL